MRNTFRSWSWDIKLMLDFQRGNKKAFEKIFDKYNKKIFNIVFRLISNRIDAEDITQEIFLKLYTNIDKYKPKSKFFTYLYTITLNHVRNYYRTQKRNKILSLFSLFKNDDQKNNNFVDNTPNQDELYSTKKEQAMVLDAINTLPLRQRSAITLFYYDNLSYQEIAEILQCSKKAVERLLARARQSLTISLKK